LCNAQHGVQIFPFAPRRGYVEHLFDMAECSIINILNKWVKSEMGSRSAGLATNIRGTPIA